MSIAPKSAIAAALLLGVTAVWVPRLTGYDPFGWLPEDLSTSSAIPSSGADPHAVVTVSEGPPSGGPGNADRAAGAPVDDELDGIPLRSLEDVVTFLERRSDRRPASGRDAGRRDLAPAPLLLGEPRSYVSEVEVLEPEPAGPVPDALRGPSFAERLESFLLENPLHTIIDGGGRTTANFGYLRVEPGDSLMEASVRIANIDLRGVLLETPEGSIRVHLPPPGARAYAHRKAAAGEERAADPPGGAGSQGPGVPAATTTKPATSPAFDPAPPSDGAPGVPGAPGEAATGATGD